MPPMRVRAREGAPGLRLGTVSNDHGSVQQFVASSKTVFCYMRRATPQAARRQAITCWTIWTMPQGNSRSAGWSRIGNSCAVCTETCSVLGFGFELVLHSFTICCEVEAVLHCSAAGWQCQGQAQAMGRAASKAPSKAPSQPVMPTCITRCGWDA